VRVVRIYILFWPVLMLLAIGNGILREATYGQALPELFAHQLSTAIAALLFGVAVLLLAKHAVPDSSKQAAATGVIWLAFTLCFEFLFGHYVAGHSWSALLQDYDLLAGRVWPLLLAWITCLPYLAYKAAL
jgi:hypothetical protein